MSDPIKREGFIREIRGVKGTTNKICLFLACGHTALIRTDTTNGKLLWQSMQETEWRTYECCRCDGSEFIPGESSML